mmetsp:Transcript_1552/g.3923  ORF Transcript_1552/g.3923 Transcript_1552/m.3923 type:complete len:275 (-) Transcript_1552:406-1230(-)
MCLLRRRPQPFAVLSYASHSADWQAKHQEVPSARGLVRRRSGPPRLDLMCAPRKDQRRGADHGGVGGHGSIDGGHVRDGAQHGRPQQQAKVARGAVQPQAQPAAALGDHVRSIRSRGGPHHRVHDCKNERRRPERLWAERAGAGHQPQRGREPHTCRHNRLLAAAAVCQVGGRDDSHNVDGRHAGKHEPEHGGREAKGLHTKQRHENGSRSVDSHEEHAVDDADSLEVAAGQQAAPAGRRRWRLCPRPLLTSPRLHLRLRQWVPADVRHAGARH